MCTSLGLSNNGRRCSTAIPDGPGAAPFRADLTFLANMPSSNSNAAGFMFRRWLGTGSRGRGGQRRGSVSALYVVSVPGANASCRQLTQLDQGMNSCGPSVGIICIPLPPPSMHRIARFDCHPHAVFQQLLPSTCTEEFETFSQFLFAHMTTSWGPTQQHPW